METKIQTKVTDQNRIAFYQVLYQHQTNIKSQLINLDQLTESVIVMIDCCGWHYKNLFPKKSIIGFETFKSISLFKLDKTYFDKIIDNQRDNRIGWPNLVIDNCAIIFDRSPMLKYISVEQISTILNNVAIKYLPSTIVLKQSLIFTDGPRLLDRFYEIVKLSIDGYIVKTVEYYSEENYWYVKFQKKIDYHE